MPSRLLQVYLPEDADAVDPELLGHATVLASWDCDGQPDGAASALHLMVPTDQTESLMDRLEDAYGALTGFGLVLLEVEATLPRPEQPEEDTSEKEGAEDDEEADRTMGRVSREELYTQITRSVEGGRSFQALVALSAVVAGVGLIKDDVAVVIGAMVIAPLLGPNMGISLAATLGDEDLMKRALYTSLVGVGIAVGIAFLMGVLLPIDPTVEAIARRTDFTVLDLVLALAAGSAGTFAFTGGVAGALIGVMVAVALVPPLVAGGMLLGDGHVSGAVGGFLLATANFASINLAGVGTFLLQGVRPRTWWEEERAKSMTRRATFLWIILIALLVGAIALKTYLDAAG